jgi:hypothetical protein
MWAPDFPEAAPSYASLFADGAFAQQPMVSANALREMAAARRIDLPFPPKDVLEPLDRSGGLAPIGFFQTNMDPQTMFLHPDAEDVVWREERNFEPWEAHGWHAYDEPFVEVSERFSPWQLLYLSDALELHAPVVAVKQLLGGRNGVGETLQQVVARADRRLRRLDEDWRPVIKFLIALQPRLWPYRRQSTTLLHEPGRPGHVDPLSEAVQSFNSAELLRRFDLSLDQLAQVHSMFAGAGRNLDPLPRWYRLSEAAPRVVTDDLRGEALRARDLYDAAYLVRQFYFLATDSWLPRSDELWDPAIDPRRQHLPRVPQPGKWKRADLKGLLVREGLYPHRIHFFVEGRTELIVLSRLLPILGFSMPGSGMAVTDIHGVDQLERHALIFAAATEVASRAVLVADLEGTLAKLVKRLREDGLFAGEEDVLLWSRDGQSIDFEEANFTEREILNAIQSAARKRVPGIRVNLDVPTLRRRRRADTRPGRKPPALAKFALAQVEEEGIRVSKPDLAEALAAKLMREIRRTGHLAEAGKRRPMLARLWFWLASERTAIRPGDR